MKFHALLACGRNSRRTPVGYSEARIMEFAANPAPMRSD